MPTRRPSSASVRTTALGIDIGGTSVRAALVDDTGHTHATARERTPSGGDPEKLAEALARLVAGVSKQVQPTVQTVGVGLPGIREGDSDIMQRAVNLSQLEGVNIRGLLERALRRPVLLETDVNAAGWAQWRALAPPPQRFVYLSVGTGVGACLILNGQIVRHTHGGAGHLGHLVVDTAPDAARCACGAQGCLEATISRQTRAGGALETEWAAKAAHSLAIALVQIAHLYAPEAIVLGGGVLDHHPELIPRVQSAFDALRSTLVPEQMTIQAAPLPTDRAGVIGVALLALQSAAET